VALLVWAFHGISLRELLDHIRHARPLWLLAAVATATLTFPLRAIRWQLILSDAQGGRFSLRPLWHAVAVGFMANNLLPARAGEFARAYVANRQLPVRFSTALASIGVERVLDGLTMVLLMLLPITAPSFPRLATIGGSSLSHVATVGAAVFGAALLLALAVVHRPAPWLALLGRIVRAVLPQRFAERLLGVAEGLVAGLEVLKNPGRFAGVLAWSLVLWVVNAASFALCFRAFALPVPVEGALLLQGLLGFGVAVPAAPGYAGVFEFVTRKTLELYGIAPVLAVSYAVAYHVTTFIPITVLGLVSLSRTNLRLGELRQAQAAES
jgi:glycosyltransferase 2 family protein